MLCSKDLLRIGYDNDGGYLVPDDLAGIAACFSPRVNECADFENDLKNRYNIPSYLADYSVENPPAGFTPAGFVKKHVGGRNDEQTITMHDWMKSTGVNQNDDLLLQMDIEGGEYRAILAMPTQDLERFRILVIEFHFLGKLVNPDFFRLFSRTVDKLLLDFQVVHLHPNNCCGNVILKGIEFPRVLGITFLRKDRVFDKAAATEFPHPLDQPNVANKNELVLPDIWFR